MRKLFNLMHVWEEPTGSQQFQPSNVSRPKAAKQFSWTKTRTDRLYGPKIQVHEVADPISVCTPLSSCVTLTVKYSWTTKLNKLFCSGKINIYMPLTAGLQVIQNFFPLDWTQRGCCQTCQTSLCIAAIKMLLQLLHYVKLLSRRLLPSAHFELKKKRCRVIFKSSVLIRSTVSSPEREVEEYRLEEMQPVTHFTLLSM